MQDRCAEADPRILMTRGTHTHFLAVELAAFSPRLQSIVTKRPRTPLSTKLVQEYIPGMLRPCPVGHTIEHVAGPSFAPCGAPPRPMYGLVPHGSDKSATDGSIVVRLFWIRSLDTKAKGNTSVENTSVRGMYRSYTPDMMIAYQ